MHATGKSKIPRSVNETCILDILEWRLQVMYLKTQTLYSIMGPNRLWNVFLYYILYPRWEEVCQTPYLFALDFCNSPVWNIEFFILLLTLILQTTVGRKIQFKLGKKSSSSNSIFQTGELQMDRVNILFTVTLNFLIHGSNRILTCWK